MSFYVYGRWPVYFKFWLKFNHISAKVVILYHNVRKIMWIRTLLCLFVSQRLSGAYVLRFSIILTQSGFYGTQRGSLDKGCAGPLTIFKSFIHVKGFTVTLNYIFMLNAIMVSTYIFYIQRWTILLSGPIVVRLTNVCRYKCYPDLKSKFFVKFKSL